MGQFRVPPNRLFGVPEEDEIEEDEYSSNNYDAEDDFKMADGTDHFSSISNKASKQNIYKSKTGNSGSNILKFYPYASNKLTRSVGTLNLSLSNVDLPSINTEIDEDDISTKINNQAQDSEGNDDSVDDYINRWSPFNDEKPSTPITLKRTASKSELSPFVNNPDILKKWKFKNPGRTNSSKNASSSKLEKSWTIEDDKENVRTKDTKFLEIPYTIAKPDQSAFASTGLVSKLLNSTSTRHQVSIPDTPVKKSPMMDHSSLSNSSIYYHSNVLDDSPNMSMRSNIHSNGTEDTSLFMQSPTMKKTPRILVENASPVYKEEKESVRYHKFPPQFHANKYKKIKKSRNSVIFHNNGLTNSLQQFTDDLYGTENNYSPSPPQFNSSRTSSREHNDLTPTRHRTIAGSRNINLISDDSSPKNSSPIRARRLINAKVATNPDSHLFERFINVGTIGNGQFSKVYQVTFAQTNKKYAVKSIQLNKYNSLKRILLEIKLLSEISNISSDQEGKEYVINFLSSWKYQNCFYIMTEYCENGNLDKFLQEQIIAKNTRLEDWRIWKIIVELSLALRFIHDSCTIAHLDLKPANVMITFEGNLKLGDFGMATHLPLEDTSFENEGDREYIAPEIISDTIYDYRADMFSLGLLIVEIAANVVLPDNGNAWHKLRSGDLSDAGRLSSTDIHSESLFSNPSKAETDLTEILDFHSISGKHNISGVGKSKIPPWVPRFLIDGESLERIVKWMIEPNFKRRPTADQILHTEECIYVEMTRKAGAVIQEDDYGPKPNFFSFEDEY